MEIVPKKLDRFSKKRRLLLQNGLAFKNNCHWSYDLMNYEPGDKDARDRRAGHLVLAQGRDDNTDFDGVSVSGAEDFRQLRQGVLCLVSRHLNSN